MQQPAQKPTPRTTSSQKTTEIFSFKNTVYLLHQNNTKHALYKSLNGFDFQKTRLTPNLKNELNKSSPKPLQDLAYKIFGSSETISPDKITIQNSFTTPHGSLTFYHHNPEKGVFEVGIYIQNSPIHPHHPTPIWQSPKKWKNQTVNFISLLKHRNKFISYWNVIGLGIFAVAYPKYKITNQIKIRHSHKLPKHHANPIIKPNPRNSWEAFNTFNPAAVYAANKIHILYRAQGHDYISSVGYATTTDGLTIQQRLDYPIFQATEPFETNQSQKSNHSYVSGGGIGGVEDPRATIIDGRVYMTYVAFDGYSPPRIALTSIALEDFLNHNWLWTRPILISPPRVVDKSACILPEKINGMYVIFHRIFPNILVDFVENLDFSGGKLLEGHYKITPRSPLWWDSRKIGAGAPPLKTSRGWLLIYQAVDDKDASHYKVGVMLLDLLNPTKVIARSTHPIIEPDQHYENDGFKAGVVYPCGAVIKDETLFVYYGAADSFVAVATSPLETFLNKLLGSQKIKMNSTKISSRQ